MILFLADYTRGNHHIEKTESESGSHRRPFDLEERHRHLGPFSVWRLVCMRPCYGAGNLGCNQLVNQQDAEPHVSIPSFRAHRSWPELRSTPSLRLVLKIDCSAVPEKGGCAAGRGHGINHAVLKARMDRVEGALSIAPYIPGLFVTRILYDFPKTVACRRSKATKMPTTCALKNALPSLRDDFLKTGFIQRF